MRLWYLLVPAIAMGSINAGYSAWRASPPSKLSEFRAQCFGKVEAAGLSRSQSIPLCNCLIGKARWYQWTHWPANYTRDVHMQFSRECVAETIETAETSPGYGTFTSDPPRSSRPLTGPGSGWGAAPDDDDDEDEAAERSYPGQPKQYGDPGYGTE